MSADLRGALRVAAALAVLVAAGVVAVAAEDARRWDDRVRTGDLRFRAQPSGTTWTEPDWLGARRGALGPRHRRRPAVPSCHLGLSCRACRRRFVRRRDRRAAAARAARGSAARDPAQRSGPAPPSACGEHDRDPLVRLRGDRSQRRAVVARPDDRAVPERRAPRPAGRGAQVRPRAAAAPARAGRPPLGGGRGGDGGPESEAGGAGTTDPGAATDVSVSFLSPEGLLVALLAAVPLAAAVLVGRRAEVVRRTLGLDEDRGLVRLQVAAAVVAVGILAGLACAQPVVAREETFDVRSDAEAYVVLDVSRSMLAAEAEGEPTRLLRARRAAARLRGALADVPVGLASLSDRVLPHVFPTVDGEAFVEALSRSVGVGRPGPQRVAVLATAFDVLGGMATLGFYREGVGRRVAIVLTDGETLPVDEEGLEGTLAGAAPVEFLFVRFWSPDERIFGAGGLVEGAYRPDPAVRAALRALLVSLRSGAVRGGRARRGRPQGPRDRGGRADPSGGAGRAGGPAGAVRGAGSRSSRSCSSSAVGTAPRKLQAQPAVTYGRTGHHRSRTKGGFWVVWLRSTRRLTVLSACILGSLFLAGCNIGGDDSEGLSSEQSDAIEESVGVADEANWATFGYTYDQNRHVPFDEITKENVADLGKVWSVDFNKIDKDVPLGQQTYPIVVGGTMYATTHFNHIFAMDAKTGAVKWHFRPSKIGAVQELRPHHEPRRCVLQRQGLHAHARHADHLRERGQRDAREGSRSISRDVPDARPEFGYYETVAPVCYKGKLHHRQLRRRQRRARLRDGLQRGRPLAGVAEPVLDRPARGTGLASERPFPRRRHVLDARDDRRRDRTRCTSRRRTRRRTSSPRFAPATTRR